MDIGRSTVLLLILVLPFTSRAQTPTAEPDFRTTPVEMPTLETIAKNVKRAYQELRSYEFEASLDRQWDDKGTTERRHNHAKVLMGVDAVTTRVFKGTGSKEKLVFLMIKDQGKKARIIQDSREDSCLSGTLKNSWIGPPETAKPPMFADRIKNGTLKGTERVGDRECYVVEHNMVEYAGGYYRRVDTFYVDTDSFRVLKWINEDYNKPGKKPWMTCAREYKEGEVRQRTQTAEAK